MARQFANNWACKIIRKGMDAKSEPEKIASDLARAPEFIKAIREGIESDFPHPGGDGAEHAIGNLLVSLEEAGTF